LFGRVVPNVDCLGFASDYELFPEANIQASDGALVELGVDEFEGGRLILHDGFKANFRLQQLVLLVNKEEAVFVFVENHRPHSAARKVLQHGLFGAFLADLLLQKLEWLVIVNYLSVAVNLSL